MVEEEDTLFLKFCCGFKFEVMIGGSQEIHQICQLCVIFLECSVL